MTPRLSPSIPMTFTRLALALALFTAPTPAHATEDLVFPWSLVPPRPDGLFHTLADPRTSLALERCALALDGQTPASSAACVRVLTLLATDKPDLHRRLRKILRTTTSPSAFTEAAAALAATPERDTIDLILLEILENRDNPHASPFLLDAYLATAPPWVIYYLRFLAIEAPDPLIRGLAAERALSLGRLRADSLPPLFTALANIPAASEHAERLHPFAEQISAHCDIPTLEAAIATKTADTVRLPSTCRDVLTPPRRRLAPFDSCRVGPLPHVARALVRQTALDCRAADPRSFYRHTALGRRFVAMRFAANAKTATPGDDLGNPWRRSPPLAPGINPPLAPKTYDPTHFPPDFWGYDPLLEQPPWYPRHLHLTIDDGPRPDVLIPALDVLDRHGVKATFFFVGSALIRRHLSDPTQLRAILRRVIDSGHPIAYHSMNHDSLPNLHESEREPDQFADSVTLYRWLVARFAGQPVPIVHGRFAGGRGAFLEQMPRLYAAAGLNQHVFWNFGPDFWVHDTSVADVRKLACTLVTAPTPMTVLLHEFPMLAVHFEALFDTIKTRCPANAVPTITETRTVWSRDDVFTPTLCDADPHPDLVGLCERSADHARRRPGTDPSRAGPVVDSQQHLPANP